MSSSNGSITKVAWITGSASGIGRVIALRLAKDGYDLALNDLPQAKEALESLVKEVELQHGRTSKTYYGDVSDPKSVESIAEKVVSDFGRLDVTIANAGIPIRKSILETTPEDLKRVTEINFYGLYYTYASSARQMIKLNNGGVIVGACSTTGFKPFPLASAYSATKAAVRSLTMEAAREWAPHGIRVNAYAPGLIDTPLWDGMKNQVAKEINADADLGRRSVLDQMSIHMTLMKRAAGPDEVANLVSFLVSPQSSYITGQSVLIDGGINYH